VMRAVARYNPELQAGNEGRAGSGKPGQDGIRFGGTSVELVTNRPVDIALRTLRAEELRHVHSWFDHLKNWDDDDHVRKLSHKLPHKDVYVLTTSDDIVIFFRKGTDTITVLDIARKETIDQFAGTE